MAQGPRAITLSQFPSLGSVHLLQHGEAWIMPTFHHQDFNLSLGTGTPPTRDAIMKATMQQGQAMGAEMTLILPMVNKVTQILGNGSQGTLLLEQGTRTLLGCIQPVVPRRPISQILFQLPVHRHCSQRADIQGHWGLHLLHLHSAQRMSLST